jgi:hypothetical protein
MAHAAESTHFYTREGKPAYTVEAKAGHQRPTTVRDARKLGLVPSVTTVIRCAAAPGLEYWKTQQAILAALTLPRLQDEPEESYLSRILSDSKEQARKAAARGTEIHAAIQGHYEGKPPAEEFWPHVRGAVAEVEKWMKGPWTAERSFSHVMGFGGKVDLSHQWAVLDFKSKEFGPDDDLRTWDEQGMQIGAYREGLLTPRAKGAIVYVSATHPGLAKLIEIPEEELQKGWKCFYSLLHFWQAKNGYVSAFEKELAA